jgi:S1-C subfamily serine protease
MPRFSRSVLLTAGLAGLLACFSGGGLLLLTQPYWADPVLGILPNWLEQHFTYDPRVDRMAREITVRILAEEGSGSGVILHRRLDKQGFRYTVLTSDHVLALSAQGSYRILTSDGHVHQGQRLTSPFFAGLDLSLVQFNSLSRYRTGTLAEPPSPGEVVYAAGFPNWSFVGAEAIKDTRSLGFKAFRLTSGRMVKVLSVPLLEGYQLGYTNDVAQGMSGGPVLTSRGEVIAINGRLKYPPQGIEAFRLENGSWPSPQEFQAMEALSWGIPSSLILPLMNQIRNSGSADYQSQSIK